MGPAHSDSGYQRPQGLPFGIYKTVFDTFADKCFHLSSIGTSKMFVYFVIFNALLSFSSFLVHVWVEKVKLDLVNADKRESGNGNTRLRRNGCE